MSSVPRVVRKRREPRDRWTKNLLGNREVCQKNEQGIMREQQMCHYRHPLELPLGKGGNSGQPDDIYTAFLITENPLPRLWTCEYGKT